MKRAVFLLGAGVGYVLGARAGRARYEQIAATATRLVQSAPARRAGDFLQHRLDGASDGIARLTGSIGERSRELPTRLVHTTESLRDDLRRRYEELGEQFTEAVERPREYLDEVVERSRDRQAQDIIAAGDLRDGTLHPLDTEHDEMIDEGGADERNLSEGA